jgi:hypothetical protein
MLAQLAGLGLDKGVGHIVDCESTATEAIWRDYVTTVIKARRRTLGNYSAQWWWRGQGWKSAAPLTPYLHSAPDSGTGTAYPGVYPGDASPLWKTGGWGGWSGLSIMQYSVKPIAGVDVSQSAIRDHTVWSGLTGGDVLVPAPDPSNAPPEAWSIPLPAAEVTMLRNRLAAEAGARAALIGDAQPRQVLDLAPVPRGEVCAPVIASEMSEWVSLGGSNSGCVGDSAHKAGFHRGANYVPADDYSRRRDPAGPNAAVNGEWACAGDFRHGANAGLRARHAALLARLMANDPSLSMVCEMITQPWADRPVMYWARWEGTANLRQYTGAGHDLWSHVSLYRSRANQRPNLWREPVALDATDKTWLTSPAFTAAVATAVRAQVWATPLWGGTAVPTAAVVFQRNYNTLNTLTTAIDKILTNVIADDAELEQVRAEIRAQAAQAAKDIVTGLAASGTADAEVAAALRAALGDRAADIGRLLAGT